MADHTAEAGERPGQEGKCRGQWADIAVQSLLLLLLQAFIKRHNSGTSPFIGAYTHYNKMYIESYKGGLKMYSMVDIHVHSK